MNDSFYDSSSQDVADEDYDNGEGYENLGQRSFLSHNILMFSAVGISLLVLVILVVWFFFPRDKSMNSEQLKILESRVGALENKLRRFDKINEHLIRLENQTKKFAHAVDRFDQFETSTALRMDVLAKELVALQTEKSDIKPVAPQVPESQRKKEEKTGTKYHIVRAGETLYSISRGYGLSVDELRKFNDLKNDTTIFPGQKLVVDPGDQQ
ncbi:MAG: LysM peptidoglycan-binding domain-containing protein [Planctomycetota bacterium]|jgi:LysM repeat protein